METNMTEGRPLTLMLRFIFPLFLGNIFQQLYNMVDTIIVGRYVGDSALAAVGSTGTIFFMVIGICNGMSTGFTVLTSQKFGANDIEGTKLSVTNGIFLSIIVVAIMTCLSLFLMHPLLHLMNTPADIYDDAYHYISTICMGVAAMVFYNLFSSFLRAIGNSRMPLIFLSISAILNIFLDLLFIIMFHLGVRGAALATVLSQVVSATACAIYIFTKVKTLKPRKEHWRFHKESVKKQLYIGLPMSLQFGITASGTMVVQTAINKFGSIAVTGFTAASKVQGLLSQGMMAIGQTTASYAGQNYGKKDLVRIHQGTKDAMKIGVVYSLAVGAAGIPLLPILMKLFFDGSVDIAPYLPWAKPYFYMCVANYIPLCMIFIYRNTVQGCGFGMISMTLGIMELLARLATAGISIFTHSYTLAAAADPAAWFSTGFFAFGLYLVLRKKMQKTLNPAADPYAE